MPMRPRSGSARMQRHRKSWSSSSLDGALNEWTWQPCGLTPDITCLMAPSLPAASIAWNTLLVAPLGIGPAGSPPRRHPGRRRGALGVRVPAAGHHRHPRPILAVVLQVAPAASGLPPSFADPSGLRLHRRLHARRGDVRAPTGSPGRRSRRWRRASSVRAPARARGLRRGTTFISAWISNVATTAMTYPIGLAMAAHTSSSGARDDAPAAAGGPARARRPPRGSPSA